MSPLTHIVTPKRIAILTVCALLLLAFITPNAVLANSGFIAAGISGILWNVVTMVFGFFVWFGGQLLNLGVNTYVIGFGQVYQNTGLGFTIDSLWVIVRDIFNLTFIFGLVFIGLRMIFDSGDSNTKKMLVSLIMAALLVNFSLFITKFVIDFSNIAASQLVNAFPAGPNGPDISGEFMRVMGLSGAFNWGGSAGFEFKGDTGSSFGYIFGTMVLFIVAAFVFLGGGLLLMIRFVVLNLYMVLSPLMFIGWIFPGAAGITKQYWSGFLGQAFFAPAYILMLYFAQKILTTFSTTGGTNSLSSIFTPRSGDTFASVVPPFVLTCIFLIAALVVAKKMGAVGAGGVISMGQTVSGRARKYATAGALVPVRAASGAVGRNTLGRIADSKSLARFNAKLNNSKLGFVAPQTRQNLIDAGKKAKFGSSQSISDVADFKQKQTARDNKVLNEYQRAGEFKKQQNEVTRLGALNVANLSDTDKEKFAATLTESLTNLSKVMKNMTSDEKAALGADTLKQKDVALRLTDDDINTFEKNGSFTKEDMDALREAKKMAVKNVAQFGSPTGPVGKEDGAQLVADAQRKALVDRAVKEVGELPKEVFTSKAMATIITPQMLEQRMRNGGLSQGDLQTIKQNLEDKDNKFRAEQIKLWEKWLDKSDWAPMLAQTLNLTPAPADPKAAPTPTPAPAPSPTLTFPPIVDPGP